MQTPGNCAEGFIFIILINRSTTENSSFPDPAIPLVQFGSSPSPRVKTIQSHLIYGLSANIERESVKSMEFNTLFMLLTKSKQI